MQIVIYKMHIKMIFSNISKNKLKKNDKMKKVLRKKVFKRNFSHKKVFRKMKKN